MNDALRAAREKVGFTQKQIADKAKLTEVSYQRIEYGQQSPRLKTAFIIAYILKSTVDKLFKEMYRELFAAVPGAEMPEDNDSPG